MGVAGTFELLGVRSRLLPSEAGIFFGDKEFPPADFPAEPLGEQNVVTVPTTRTPEGEPDATLELVIGVRMTEPGVARSRGAEITYRVGDRQYREVIEQPLTLCAPIAEYVGEGKECPPTELADQFGDKVIG